MLFSIIICVLHPRELLASENDRNRNTTFPSKYVLVGTVVGTNSQPLALIQVVNEKLHFYSLNDNVGPYTITKIHRDKVLLSLNENSYTLLIHQKFFHHSNISDSENNLTAELPEQILIKRQLLNHIRNNIQQWLNAISLKLEITDGYLSGYIIESIGNIPIKQPIGLKPGDIIRSINGVHVSQPEMFTQMLNNLIESTTIDIQVERSHKTNLLNFHVTD